MNSLLPFKQFGTFDRDLDRYEAGILSVSIPVEQASNATININVDQLKGAFFPLGALNIEGPFFITIAHQAWYNWIIPNT